ncbi:adhesion G-protein coupled receptor G5-like [Parambassis ranga]|uniref:Adhesion G-protein coupled receptor G5-like n=1 Tax=Parambassis ranga TaxID=210632 RepID=A0A6P7I6A9_9TELE|nr:adhesion G-protein coupled receptor G5-like [Parambassis ranga]
MLIRKTMVPLLLFLLLHESLGGQNPNNSFNNTVCFNISNYGISVSTADLHISVMDHAECQHSSQPCVILCSYSNGSWLNTRSGCLEAQVTNTSFKVEFSIQTSVNCTIYNCENSTIIPLIQSLNSHSSDPSGIIQLFKTRRSCLELFRKDRAVKEVFIKMETMMIHDIMGTTKFKTRQSVNYNLKMLSMNVINVTDDNCSAEVANNRIQLEAPQLLPENSSFVPDIFLPVNALKTIPEEKRIIGLVSYMDHSHFQFELVEVSSMVQRIELQGGHRLQNLKPPIKMNFRVRHTDVADNSQFLCHYFDEFDHTWRTDGCETHNKTYNDHQIITCYCDHNTPFAVLLIRQPISEIQWKILSYISYIGCGISAFFTAMSIVIHVFSSHRRDNSISIHASLSGALFLLNTTFLLTEVGATVESDWVCVFIAAFMHYSLLCCFTWMAIEAFHLYLLLIKVFNTHYKHYLVKLSLAGWGIPGVIVSVSLGMMDYKQLYGPTHLSMADTNQTNTICWITDDSFFYSLNLVYFTLIFIFNSGILMAVGSSICKIKQAFKRTSKLGTVSGKMSGKIPERSSASCKSGLTLLGLTCLMGTTWGLAFLGSGYINYPILYLFCILNSTQGFFIFLWICLAVKKQRRRYMEDKMSSTPAKTLTTKSD